MDRQGHDMNAARKECTTGPKREASRGGASPWIALSLGCLGAAAVLAAATACGPMLPQAGLILDTRALALRVEVTMPLVPDEPGADIRAQALPFERVRLVPFVVDPDGVVDIAQRDPIWIFCDAGITQGPTRCILDAAPARLEDLDPCIDPDVSMLGEGFMPSVVPTCTLPSVATPEFVVPLSSNALSGADPEVSLILGTPGGTSSQACAQAYLSGGTDVPLDCTVVTQRIDVGPIERLLIFLDSVGIDLGVPIPDESTVPDYDRHPPITRFKYAIVETKDEDPTALTNINNGDVILVPRDTLLRIEVDSPESSLQLYPVQTAEGTADCSFEVGDENCEQEAYSGSWFRTWGDLLSDSSDDPSSYNVYTFSRNGDIDSENPPTGGAFVFYVVRDGRSGVDWRWFIVQEAPAP